MKVEIHKSFKIFLVERKVFLLPTSLLFIFYSPTHNAFQRFCTFCAVIRYLKVHISLAEITTCHSDVGSSKTGNVVNIISAGMQSSSTTERVPEKKKVKRRAWKEMKNTRKSLHISTMRSLHLSYSTDTHILYKTTASHINPPEQTVWGLKPLSVLFDPESQKAW